MKKGNHFYGKNFRFSPHGRRYSCNYYRHRRGSLYFNVCRHFTTLKEVIIMKWTILILAAIFWTFFNTVFVYLPISFTTFLILIFANALNAGFMVTIALLLNRDKEEQN